VAAAELVDVALEDDDAAAVAATPEAGDVEESNVEAM
jgi:hypothetical protein